MNHSLAAIAASRHPARAATEANRGGAAVLVRTGLRSAGMLFALALCAFAQGPAGAAGIERLVATDAVRHLTSKEPLVRGEAALIVASTGVVQQESRLLQLASDPEPAARYRATIALGLLATPAAVQELESRLCATDDRASPDGVAAAFALGLIPPEHIGTSIARTLPLFRRGSYKRQHDVLLALLTGMAQHPERSEQLALRDLLDDESNRAPDVRALLLRLLLPIDATLDERLLRRTLQRGSDAERRVLLGWLANRRPGDNEAWLSELTRVARSDRDADVRATALVALARSRHLPALEIAARALRSSSPRECGEALQAMLAIGGASMRGVLEQHLLDERDAIQKAALLQNFAAPLSDRLVDHTVALALDREQPLAVRTAAAELLSRSQPQRAAPLLRDLFRTAADTDDLRPLARALHRVEATPTALDRLLEDPADLGLHPRRWQALLAAGHSEAQRRVLAVLEQPASTTGQIATALTAWRTAMVLDLDAVEELAAPMSLRELLQ